jgi:hypothetical protein
MTDTTLNRYLAQGTHTQRLAFTPVPATPASGPNPSTTWYETDTATFWAWDFVGTAWHQITAGAAVITTTLGITIDGGGAPPATGIKGDLFIPVACTVVEAVMLADVAGSAVIDVWRAAIGTYPPVVGGSIVGADPPTLSTASHSTDTTLTGWNTALLANDTLRFNLNSASTLNRISLALKVTVP